MSSKHKFKKKTFNGQDNPQLLNMKNKPDLSPRVYQRDKLKKVLEIHSLPWTDNQKKFLELALNKESKIVFVSGPAGTAKTILAVYSCLELLNSKRISDIMYIRAAVESADAKLGFLPGTVDEKLLYYGLPLIDKLEELLPKADQDLLKKENRYEVAPVNFARGRSWNTRGVIIDEAQNFTLKELVTVLTRLGQYNKCFVLGDPMQSDINGKSGAFIEMMDLFKDDGESNGVVSFSFTKEDILRSELTKYLVEKFELLISRHQQKK